MRGIVFVFGRLAVIHRSYAAKVIARLRQVDAARPETVR
jgi:hypothetical protein